MMTTGDEVEIREYKRLTKLNYLDRALGMNCESHSTNRLTDAF